MPVSKKRGRGKILRYRTKKIGAKKYIHIAVMAKKGKRGGRTVAGKVHTIKKGKK